MKTDHVIPKGFDFKKIFLVQSYTLVFISVLLFNKILLAQDAKTAQTMEVGVAHVDITPDGPIRLAGYGSRSKSESTGILRRLSAKAIAFGSDAQRPSILITVDLV